MSEINVTPLIDLAFALLIIFMITTPLLEQSITLQLPVETQKPQANDSETRYETISIKQDGQLHWGDEPVDDARLEELIRRASERPNQPVITLRADARLPYQRVIDVLDMLKRYKLSQISLDTQAL